MTEQFTTKSVEYFMRDSFPQRLQRKDFETDMSLRNVNFPEFLDISYRIEVHETRLK